MYGKAYQSLDINKKKQRRKALPHRQRKIHEEVGDSDNAGRI